MTAFKTNCLARIGEVGLVFSVSVMGGYDCSVGLI